MPAEWDPDTPVWRQRPPVFSPVDNQDQNLQAIPIKLHVIKMLNAQMLSKNTLKMALKDVFS